MKKYVLIFLLVLLGIQYAFSGTVTDNVNEYVFGQKMTINSNLIFKGTTITEIATIPEEAWFYDAPEDGVIYGRKNGVWTNAIPSFAYFRDEKANGTTGGSYTNNVWQRRVLNTVVTNGITSASLTNTNTISLPAGTYHVKAKSPGFYTDATRVRIFDLISSTELVIGSSSYLSSSVGVVFAATVEGRFVLSSTGNITLEHRANTTRLNTGLGVAASFGVNEIYGEIYLWKIE